MSDEPEAPEALVSLRQSIDNIDAALVYMLAARFKCTRLIGELKAASGLPAADPSREAVQISRLRRLAGAANLDAVFAEKFLKFIIEEVIRHHNEVAADSHNRAGQ